MSELDTRLRAEYQARRRQAEAERDERMADAIRRDGEIGALQQRLRARFAQSTREMLARPKDSDGIADQLRRDVSQIQSEIARRLGALGMPEDALSVRCACDVCQDTGYVGELRQTMCECMKLRRMQLMREDAGLTGGDGQTFEAFDPSVFPEGTQRERALGARALCEKYTSSLLGGGALNLVLMGESGLGKTYLLNCVAARAIQQGVPAMPMSAFQMLGAMREYHFGQTGEDAQLNQMLSAELLLIDDLGTEPMLRNITVEYLFMLLNERMSRRLHTVIATNLSPGELLERYNERVVSRLMDRTKGEFIRLTGKDIRFR